LNDESNAAGHCVVGTGCDETGYSKRGDAIGAATAATVSFVAGSVLLAAGVTLFLVGRPGSESASVAATPVVGSNEAAIVLGGTF
jgi:hypothetical protein